jgi:hypothetical protein
MHWHNPCMIAKSTIASVRFSRHLEHFASFIAPSTFVASVVQSKTMASIALGCMHSFNILVALKANVWCPHHEAMGSAACAEVGVLLECCMNGVCLERLWDLCIALVTVNYQIGVY